MHASVARSVKVHGEREGRGSVYLFPEAGPGADISTTGQDRAQTAAQSGLRPDRPVVEMSGRGRGW
jgi:hypothetical protein